MVAFSTDRREQQIDAGCKALRQIVGWAFDSTMTRTMVTKIYEAGDEIPDASLEWTMNIVDHARELAYELEQDPNSTESLMARRNLQECFRSSGASASRVYEWELRNEQGEVIGTMRGTRDEYDRTQAGYHRRHI